MGRGFSLIELVVVVVVIGIIAVIAIPRLTRGASHSGEAALRSDLDVLRRSIELYRAEHGGNYPAVDSFVSQMVSFSDLSGSSFSSTADPAGGIVYGPYLQAIPPVPIGSKKGKTAVAANHGATTAWCYGESPGHIHAATLGVEVDADGVKYSDY